MSRIYSNFENGHAERAPARPSLEMHCEHILQRAPTITKDLIGRMQNTHIAKTHICGYEFKTKQLWVLAGLFFLFLFSVAGTILLWFTTAFDSFVLSNLIIANNTDAFKFWSRPTAKNLMKVHIFNYTNVDDFERGLADKLNVQDLGPYVYEESRERTNIQFNDDGTVSYQDKFSYKFIPQLSRGRQSDRVVVPNLMVMSAAERTQEAPLFTKFATSLTLGSVMNKKPFMKLAAHRFIWGYEDSVYQLAKGFLAFENPDLQDQMGLLTKRNGTSSKVITINTGSNGLEELGLINKYNGEKQMGYWSTEECDSLSSSDGSIFPPRTIRQRENVNLYIPEICRKLPFAFNKEIKMLNGTVPAYRYVMPEEAFASADNNFMNQCYCDLNSGICPPHGFINMSLCNMGAPLFMSLPHMYNVDPAYIKVSGLDPKPEQYINYLDIHPMMGFPMSGQVRLQMNVLARKSFGFVSMDLFNDDNIMLPVAWFDAGITEDKLPQDILDVIYKSTFTVRGVELTSKYGSLLTGIVTLVAISMIIKAKWQARKMRHASTETRLVA